MSDPATLLQNLSAAFSDLAAKEAPSVVSVRAHRARASGFVWRPGLIITAEEALPEEGDFEVTLPGGETIEARLAGRDPGTDIALLRVEPAERADRPVVLVPSVPPVGALAMAVGAEEGAPTAAIGVVSRATGPWMSLRGSEIAARIELGLRLRRSAEGGIVLDAAGQAVGMAVFGPRRRTLVIPAATIERVAQRLESHGRVGRGYLGLGLQQVAVTGAGGRGAMVMNVDPQGPGAQAGIHQGDIIVAFDGAPIRHLQAVLRALGPDSVGRTVTLRLRRGGEERDVPLTIGERPAA